MKKSNTKKFAMQKNCTMSENDVLFEPEQNLYNNPESNEILTFDQKIIPGNTTRNSSKKLKKESFDEI